MAIDQAHLEELTRRIEALSNEERERLFSRFPLPARQFGKPVSPNFRPRTIKGGSFEGVTFSREELYGDDGR